jgi:hypothetical protein
VRFVPTPVRVLGRRFLRRLLRIAPGRVHRAAARVPFSRWRLLASDFLWGEEVIDWRDVRIRVNPGEVHGYYPYLLGDYSSEEIDKLIEVCREGVATLADVGANRGMVSLALAQACPGLSVIAFEPEPAIAAGFRDNLGLNPDLSGRIELQIKAVADVDGEVFF